MTKEKARELIHRYGEAWVTQNLELVLSIFTTEAIYHDPHEPKALGREGIKSYWKRKIIGEQRDISFKLLNLWTENDIVVAEWEAEFIDTKRNVRIQLKEVAICTTENDKFSSLREYYSSKKTPL